MQNAYTWFNFAILVTSWMVRLRMKILIRKIFELMIMRTMRGRMTQCKKYDRRAVD